MAGETTITVIGNLTRDPELRFTPTGDAVTAFTIASTPRVLDRQTNQWKDGDALFLRCSIWRQPAEHVAESLAKGMRVIVTGRLKQRTFETREGEKRTVVELDVDEIGPSLKFATARVVKATRGTPTGPAPATGSYPPHPAPAPAAYPYPAPGQYPPATPTDDDPFSISPGQPDPWASPAGYPATTAA
ncbi:single-stranded DNA-binding protein [Frankia sp. Cj3]|uniref:single-stranded DNA-binding protein n=1 Tax=Frankia sp. Cj3 TaxID=2880976 RepID=UPI001EF5A475|nr:single-stranded DNA-binding protein [Frankia sp. Cj3]